MLRKVTKAVVVAVLCGAVLALSQSSEGVRAEDKKEEKKLTTKQIMSTGHKGADALFAKAQAAVKAKKWEDAKGPTDELAANASLFPKATPPRDDKKTWEELSKKYTTDTKSLADAVEKKDEAAATKAIGALNASCKSCHENHRGKK
jgi:cytochrome c556